MFFVVLQFDSLGANSYSHELVAPWVKERTEPLVHEQLLPPQVQTAVQGKPLSWPLSLVISMEGKNRFSHGVQVWHLNSANSNSNTGVTCNEILIGHKLLLVQEVSKYWLGLSLA